VPAQTADYRNEGLATPLATLQTFAWACDRGDIEVVQKLLFFDGPARAKAEALLASMPSTARTAWKSPEEMAATLLTSANMNGPFPGAAILEKATVEPIREGRVMLRLPDTPKDRGEYQKTEDGWRYVITEKMVDDYLARNRGRPLPEP